MPHPELGLESFSERFTEEMIRITGDTSIDLKNYANTAAESYWEEMTINTEETPEECAKTDHGYWVP